MNLSVDKGILISQIASQKLEEYHFEKIIAYYSAAIAVADEDILSSVLRIGKNYNIKRNAFYEIVLQSYLFLGFPRMLIAVDNLNEIYPCRDSDGQLSKISPDEASSWFENGVTLCREVYKNMYEPLKENVSSIAPEVFRWMIIEGYGKVLSRDTLTIQQRELSIISFLLMENRKKQLFSHIKGALNVGVEENLVKMVIDDIGKAAGDGYRSALDILDQIGIK